jgi:hypothetical protein
LDEGVTDSDVFHPRFRSKSQQPAIAAFHPKIPQANNRRRSRIFTSVVDNRGIGLPRNLLKASQPFE